MVSSFLVGNLRFFYFLLIVHVFVLTLTNDSSLTTESYKKLRSKFASIKITRIIRIENVGI